MAVYVMLSRLTDQGAQTVKTNPERIFEVDDQLKQMGVKVKDQYVVLGRYDFVNIIEAPDDATVARAAVEIASRGSVRIETLRAMPVQDFVKNMESTGAMASSGAR